MAAATTAINTPTRAGDFTAIPVAAATSIYQGTLVARDAAGNLVSAADAVGLKVIGRAEETVDNSAGVAGDLTCRVQRGTFRFQNDVTNAVDKSHIGTVCYVLDNQTVDTDGGTNNIKAGLVVDVDDDGVWVDTSLAPAL